MNLDDCYPSLSGHYQRPAALPVRHVRGLAFGNAPFVRKVLVASVSPVDRETLRIKCMAHDFKMINAFAHFPMRFRVTHEQMF